MELFKTKHVVYTAPTTDVPNMVYAVDVVNVNEFFSCRFYINTKARADLKTDLTQRVLYGIVNSVEFHNFWKSKGIELPKPLDIMLVSKAVKEVYKFNVYMPNMELPLWVEAYNESHAGILLDGLITRLGHHPMVCNATRVK